MQCDKKFLYKDALQESQIKLGLRDQKQDTLFDDL